jgi:hypothetical protein
VVWFAIGTRLHWHAFVSVVAARELAKAAVLAGGGKNAFSRFEKGKVKPVALTSTASASRYEPSR